MSKYQSEGWCQFYNSKFGMKISVVRLFHVVGARMQPHRETPKFVKAVLAGEPVSIHGKFNQSDFSSSSFGYTNVWDCVEGIELVMRNTSDIFEIYNIGSKNHLAVLDIYKIITQELGLQTEIIYTPLMEHETLGCVAETTKIAKLGWIEKHQAKQAVVDYVSWYKANFVTTSENSKKTKRLSGVLVGNF